MLRGMRGCAVDWVRVEEEEEMSDAEGQGGAKTGWAPECPQQSQTKHLRMQVFRVHCVHIVGVLVAQESGGLA